MALTAIILSGGRSTRFGGVHKPGVEVEGRSVISRILSAVRELDPTAEVVVAGPSDGLTAAEVSSVMTVREEPEFSGPLAGIAAAAEVIAGTGVILVIAGDMPMVTAGHLGRLVAECARTGSPVAGTDDRGRAQFLCAAWPHAVLRERLTRIGDPTDKAVRLLFAAGEPVVVDVDPHVVVDFDTVDELDRIRADCGGTGGRRAFPQVEDGG